MRIFVASILACSVVGAVQAGPIAVNVVNQSEPVLCAEKDNVALIFSNPKIRSLKIQAAHPAYIGMISVDRDAPDFTSCDMTQDPVFASDNPGQVTLYQSSDLWITGFTFGAFWRPASVPVHVFKSEPAKAGNAGKAAKSDSAGQAGKAAAAAPARQTFEGLHMLQIWVRHGERAEEVLVLYPPDGYWRARPLAFGQMRWTAYGSSFLVGPVQDLGRPVVAFESITFNPQDRAFEMTFAHGGRGTLKLAKVDREHMELEVDFTDIDPKLPFAALRSMYVTRTNADASEVAWRTPGGKGWEESSIMTFKDAKVEEIWAGRSVPSRHNLSAPDMVFGPFMDGK